MAIVMGRISAAPTSHKMTRRNSTSSGLRSKKGIHSPGPVLRPTRAIVNAASTSPKRDRAPVHVSPRFADAGSRRQTTCPFAATPITTGGVELVSGRGQNGLKRSCTASSAKARSRSDLTTRVASPPGGQTGTG
jgi:hypothetical protein